MPISKNTRRRYILIDGILKSIKHYTINEIMEKVNEQLEEDGYKQVSLRMIYKDIENMQAEFSVSILKRADGTYQYESKEDSISNEILRREDRNIIEMALQAFSIYKGSGLFDKFDDVITRLMAGSVLRGLNKEGHKKYIQIGELIGETGQRWIEPIYDAIINSKTIKIQYKGYGQAAKTRVISPYLLKEYRNIWYLVAHYTDDSNIGKTNIFKLTRIQKVEPSGEPFQIDETFNKDDYFKYSLGVFHLHGQRPIEVKIKFNSSLITLVSENKIHPSMEIISKTEHEMIVTLNVYNTIELKTLILSYGANAQVLEPQELKEEIKEMIRQSYRNYFFE